MAPTWSRISTDYRLHTHVPRSKRRGQTELVDLAGEHHAVAAGFADEAQLQYAAILGFLSGDAPRLRVVTGPTTTSILGGVLGCFLGLMGFIFGFARHRR